MVLIVSEMLSCGQFGALCAHMRQWTAIKPCEKDAHAVVLALDAYRCRRRTSCRMCLRCDLVCGVSGLTVGCAHTILPDFMARTSIPPPWSSNMTFRCSSSTYNEERYVSVPKKIPSTTVPWPCQFLLSTMYRRPEHPRLSATVNPAWTHIGPSSPDAQYRV